MAWGLGHARAGTKGEQELWQQSLGVPIPSLVPAVFGLLGSSCTINAGEAELEEGLRRVWPEGQTSKYVFTFCPELVQPNVREVSVAAKAKQLCLWRVVRSVKLKAKTLSHMPFQQFRSELVEEAYACERSHGLLSRDVPKTVLH